MKEGRRHSLKILPFNMNRMSKIDENEKKTKRVSLYYDIVKIIKNLLNITPSKEDLKKEVNKDILLDMFEIYMESNEKIIESLYSENNVKNYFKISI